MYPAIAGLGPTELLIIFAVIILLFGAAKLPELARGSGRALRIFKAETRGLMDDDDDDAKPASRPASELPATERVERVERVEDAEIVDEAPRQPRGEA